VFRRHFPASVRIEEPGIYNLQVIQIVEIICVELPGQSGDQVGGMEADGQIMLPE